MYHRTIESMENIAERLIGLACERFPGNRPIPCGRSNTLYDCVKSYHLRNKTYHTLFFNLESEPTGTTYTVAIINPCK